MCTCPECHEEIEQAYGRVADDFATCSRKCNTAWMEKSFVTRQQILDDLARELEQKRDPRFKKRAA